MRGCQQPCPRGAEDENELRDTHCVPWCPASHLPWPRKLQGTWPGPWPSSLTSRVICGGNQVSRAAEDGPDPRPVQWWWWWWGVLRKSHASAPLTTATASVPGPRVRSLSGRPRPVLPVQTQPVVAGDQRAMV